MNNLANTAKRSPFMAAAIGLALTVSPVLCSAMDAILGGDVPTQIFPDGNHWNEDISAWPVDPNSTAFIANARNRSFHANLGGDVPNAQSANATYGIPYIVVSNVQQSDLVTVKFNFSQISDGVDHTTDTSYPFYPIPLQAATQAKWIEGGEPGNVDLRSSQDRHMIIVDRDRNYLYELYNVYFDTAANQWHATTGAFWDMNTNDRRPDTWMSADGAGLAMLPGILRYDEVYDPNVTEIDHALRFTVSATNAYVFPASHWDGFREGALPMGARLRLKANVDIAGKTTDPNMQKILRALKKHGLILADVGSDLYVTGSYDPKWNTSILNRTFGALTANDFEVVQLGYPEIKPATLSSIALSQSAVVKGSSVSLTINLSAPAPTGGAVISLTSSNPAVLSGPTKVTIPQGKSTLTLTGKVSSSITADTTVIINVKYKLVTLNTTLNVLTK